MLILKPMTEKELRDNMDENGYIEADVIIGFHNILNVDMETFLDCISEAATGSPLLMDVAYQAIGIADKDNLIIRVRGDASEIIGEDTEGAE